MTVRTGRGSPGSSPDATEAPVERRHAERGIRVNCVAPGPIWTPPMVPMKRPGQPRGLAPVYVMLASEAASCVSGATVAVTGGKPII